MMKPLSVTSLSSYLYCKRKLFLQQVLKIYEPAKEPLIFGSIRHDTFEQISKAEESIVKKITPEHTDDDVLKIYSSEFAKLLRTALLKNKGSLNRLGIQLPEAFRREWRFIAIESSIRAKNIIEFISKNKLYGEELWLKLTPKIKSEYSIASETLGLRGIIDQIEVHQDKLVPIELKTGTPPAEGVWPSHRVQLAAYLMLLSEHFSTDLTEGYVTYLDIRDRRKITLNPFMKDEILGLIKDVNCLINSADLPEIEKNENKCSACGIREICHNNELLKEKITTLKQKNLNTS